jgi:KDO2-lipid IV(A) lauroyltransferase
LLLYYLLRIIVFPFSILPFPVLYFISDGIYFLVFHLIGYRKKVVWQNLKNSFPEKTEAELKQIQKKFYQNFCDLIVESIKFFNISEEEIRKRCTFSNPEMADKYHDNFPCLFGYTGHIGNWEFAGISVGYHVKFWPVVPYKPFSSKVFEQLMSSVRWKHLDLVPYYSIKETLEEKLKKSAEPPLYRGRKPVYVFSLDQAPSRKNSTFWTTFLHQETCFYTKVEDLAREYNLPVIFCDLQRVKRGYYNVHLTLIAETPAETQPLEITKKYVQLLEEVIKKDPDNWLWTHRRWKRKRNS